MAKVGNVGLGFGVASGDAPTAPAAPSITSVVAGTDSLTVTVKGAAGSPTHTVLYKPAAVAAWSVGGTRVGDGVVTIAGLTAGGYHVQAYSSSSGVHSTPGTLILAQIAAADRPVAQAGILTVVESRVLRILTALNNDAGSPLFKNIEQVDGVNQHKTVGGKPAEKCVDHWAGQIAFGGSGQESFERFAPFAFVRAGLDRIDREGGFDANLRITLDISLGQSDPRPLVARLGADDKPGTNRILEKVFMALDDWHPDNGLTLDESERVQCNPFYLTDALVTNTTLKSSGLQLHFEADWIPLKT
jgi:hypothetical protein